MRSYLVRSVNAMVLAVFVWSMAAAQTAPKKTATSGPQPAADDLTGVWLLRGGGGAGGPGAQNRLSAWEGDVHPTLTPMGQKLMDEHKPSRGPRTVLPSLQNDPQSGGNPPGAARTFIYGVYGMEWLKLPDSMFQVLEWYHQWRRIWTDGRKMPDWDSIGPYWYGYSVGQYKGTEFEVQTESLDNRAWLDDWGTPFSEAMKMTEHWKRVNHDTLTLQLDINDPMAYTAPWTTRSIRYAFQPKGTPHGELFEAIFAPLDEEHFNAAIRDPGVYGKEKADPYADK